MEKIEKIDGKAKSIMQKRSELIKAQYEAESQVARIKAQINDLQADLFKIDGQEQLAVRVAMRW